jgi:hypothetical protein
MITQCPNLGVHVSEPLQVSVNSFAQVFAVQLPLHTMQPLVSPAVRQACSTLLLIPPCTILSVHNFGALGFQFNTVIALRAEQ